MYDENCQNSLLIELFKTLVALVKKHPSKVYPYVYPFVGFIINFLNIRDIDIKTKNISLNALNEIIKNCEYVILPYFHFPQLY